MFGPRGTGKTTWLNRHFDNALMIDLLSAESFRLYSARPERLEELIEGNPDKKLVVISEARRACIFYILIFEFP